MASKHTKQSASEAKRAATKLREMAEYGGLGIEERGILLAAVRVVESFAQRQATKAKEQKRDEQDYQRRYDAAQTKAHQIITQAMQTAPARDKIALIEDTDAYLLPILADHISRHPQSAEQQLGYELRTAICSCSRTAAYASIHNDRSVVEVVTDCMWRVSTQPLKKTGETVLAMLNLASQNFPAKEAA
jgi:hypothetical protein